ncbi:hypothetical protein [Marinicellulosiphila megalodicopiae]|uniref:hypothetical protein n=1 Tax=Marinicellulosiphila megalodicopiae TaxID=2724896 RepID=UPI003BAEECD1
MKNSNYQIVQFTYQKDDVNYVFIESFQLINDKPLDLDDLMTKLEIRAKNSEEKPAIESVLEQHDADEVGYETLALLSDIGFEQAISEKHQFISAINLKQNKLLNTVTSSVEDKELLAKHYTREIVAYFKAHHDEYPSLTVKAMSKLRDIAVRFMLNGYDIEKALDEAYDAVMDS